MKHFLFAVLVLWLTVLGSGIIVSDLIDCTEVCKFGGELNAVPGGVGSLLLLLAVAFAIPLRFREALAVLKPIADEAQDVIHGNKS